MLTPGIHGHAALRVTTENTAKALGSGELPVLATPVGMVVQCDCTLTAVEDRRLRFTARVYDDVTEVASATHERYIVDKERFTSKANSKLTAGE